jgi:tetratricopeptide (TPR) repeat protein
VGAELDDLHESGAETSGNLAPLAVDAAVMPPRSSPVAVPMEALEARMDDSLAPDPEELSLKLEVVAPTLPAPELPASATPAPEPPVPDAPTMNPFAAEPVMVDPVAPAPLASDPPIVEEGAMQVTMPRAPRSPEAERSEAPPLQPDAAPQRAPYAGPLSASIAPTPPMPAPITPRSMTPAAGAAPITFVMEPAAPVLSRPAPVVSRPAAVSRPVTPAPHDAVGSAVGGAGQDGRRVTTADGRDSEREAAHAVASDVAALRAVAIEAMDTMAAPAGAGGWRAILRAPLVVSDRGMVFAVVAAAAWLALVAFPLTLSLAFAQPLNGLPLVGVIVWLAFLRVARWISPPARADRLLRQGRYNEALASCDASLAVTGEGAWVGVRRLIWLNRRVAALLGLGRYDEALRAALAPMEQSADPETIANVALALLRLNRYEDAIIAARLVSGVTRERSVRANATLAAAMLARGLPAEADALASASLADIEALSPYVRRESHTMCLSALVRARRAQGRIEGPEGARAALARLKRLAGRERVPRAIALLEEAALLADSSAPEAWDEVERLARAARALAPGYTLWRLTQPDAPLTSMTGYLQGALRGQVERAPSSEAVAALLRQASARMRPRPPRLSSSTALLAQIITVGATLALLALWTVMFFVIYIS